MSREISSQKFGITYILLLVVQLAICNYVNLTPLVTATLLPAMIMCLPLEIGIVPAMLIAFASGLCVDLLADTVVGLNAFALVPVALCRKTILTMILGVDSMKRDEALTFKAKGILKVTLVMLVSVALFMMFYISADGAAVRSTVFNLLRFLLSTLVSYLLSLAVVRLLSPDRE